MRTNIRHSPVDIHAVTETPIPGLPVTGSQPTPGSSRPHRDPVPKRVHPDCTPHMQARVSRHTSATHTIAQRRRTWAPAAFEIQIGAVFCRLCDPAARPPSRVIATRPPSRSPAEIKIHFRGDLGGAQVAAASAGSALSK